ncbi:MAG: class B sortase [Oscillospiraceae bacterium]|nr:class B sortase [Oscillospiraceae bacterium]
MKISRTFFLRLILFLLSAAAVIFAGIQLWKVYSGYAKGQASYEALSQQYTHPAAEASQSPSGPYEPQQAALISVDFDALQAQCPDVVAWLFFPDTPINYPVVQSGDNNYYLRRLLDGTYNSSGTLFMDYRSQPDFSDWNTVIYGHNMNDGSMFAVLPSFREQDFVDEHPAMYLLTPEETWQVDWIAGCTLPADAALYTLPPDQEGRDQLLQSLLEASCFRTDVEVTDDDRLLTLSTCVYDYKDARFVLVGVLRTPDHLKEGSEHE